MKTIRQKRHPRAKPLFRFNQKKLILFFSFFCLFAYKGYGQVIIGLKAGMNASTIKMDMEVSKSKFPRVGFHGGALAQVDLTEKRFVRAELLYSIKGSRFEPTAQYPFSDAYSSFHYLNLPLLQAYRPTKNISLLVGPELGYLIKANTFYGGKFRDITKHYRRLDFALDVGFGYRILSNLNLEARYSHGFKIMTFIYDLDASGKATGEPKYDGANRMLQVGFNYYLPKELILSKRKHREAID